MVGHVAMLVSMKCNFKTFDMNEPFSVDYSSATCSNNSFYIRGADWVTSLNWTTHFLTFSPSLLLWGAPTNSQINLIWPTLCLCSTFSPPQHSFYFQRFFFCSRSSIIILACIFCDTLHALMGYFRCC